MHLWATSVPAVQPILHLRPPVSAYPRKVLDLCATLVQELRRTSGAKVAFTLHNSPPRCREFFSNSHYSGDTWAQSTALLRITHRRYSTSSSRSGGVYRVVPWCFLLVYRPLCSLHMPNTTWRYLYRRLCPLNTVLLQYFLAACPLVPAVLHLLVAVLS